MNPEARRRKLESYGNAYSELLEGLKQFPREMWRFRSAPGEFTIHEIIVHIADSEANSYVRCRRFIAEPGSRVLGYDENKWARDLHYHEQSPDDALDLFKGLRRSSYLLVRSLPESDWGNTVTHSEAGLMTMDDWLDTYARHIPEHLAQMRAVHETWLQQRLA
jgi:hypothetical protein